MLETFAPRRPSFTHDGTEVVFTQGDTLAGRGSLARVPATGGTPPTTVAVSRQLPFALGTAELGARESDPSAPPSSALVVRAGARATLRYAVPADPTASFVVATRTSPGLPPKALRAGVPQPLVDTGVVSGRTYTYALRQVDRSGYVGPARAVVLRQSAPATSVRVSGQQLTAGQLLRSSNGVRLRVELDGNVVVASPSGRVLFQTRTGGTRPALRVKADGNVVLSSGSRVLWHTRTAGQGTVALVVQGDGNAVLYRDRDGRAAWSSRGGRAY